MRSKNQRRAYARRQWVKQEQPDRSERAATATPSVMDQMIELCRAALAADAHENEKDGSSE